MDSKERIELWRDFFTIKIKAFRQLTKLSQDKLSDALGVSRSIVSNWEQGRSDISLPQLLLANESFNKYSEENDLGYAKDVFVKYVCGIVGSQYVVTNFKPSVYKPKHKGVNKLNKLLSNFNKLSDIDQAKITERIEYILSTYTDEDCIPTKKIPLIGQTACGNPIEAIVDADEYINTKELQATFALKAYGNSMSPLINNDDIIFIRRCNKLDIGKIGIFQINESGFSDDEKVTCKMLKSINNGFMTLMPLNPAYDPIVVDTKKHNVKIIGEYISKL